MANQFEMKKSKSTKVVAFEIERGTNLVQARNLAYDVFGTLENVWISTFRDHYRGNAIGDIIKIEEDQNFDWSLYGEDRGVNFAYIIKGDPQELLDIRKKMTNEIKSVDDQFPPVQELYQRPDYRFKKERLDAIIENNNLARINGNKRREKINEKRELLSKVLQASIFNVVSARQCFYKNGY